MSGIARGVAINLVTRLVAMAFGLGLMVITARLGTREQGAFALFTAVEAALLTLGSGFGVLIARRISHHREHPGALAGAVVVACLVGGLVAAIAFATAAVALPADYRFLMVLAAGAPLVLLAPNLVGLWLGAGRMEAMARVTLGVPVLTLTGLLIVFVAYGEIGLWSVLWCWVGARSIVGLATWAAALREGWLGWPDVGGLMQQWRFVALIGATNLIGLLNYRVGLFLVERLVGLSETGVYSVAVLLAELLWVVSSSVSQAAYSRIGDPDRVKASRLTVRAMHSSLIALVLLSVPLWFAVAWLLPQVLGEAYAPSLPSLAVLLPGAVAYGAASALSAYFTNHAGRPYIPAALAGLSLVSGVLMSLVLIPAWGIVGAAAATTLSYVAAVGVSVSIFSKLAAIPIQRVLWPDWRALKQDLDRLKAYAMRPRY
jgi:O-antigen/teichoic acid export membrane protein